VIYKEEMRSNTILVIVLGDLHCTFGTNQTSWCNRMTRKTIIEGGGGVSVFATHLHKLPAMVSSNVDVKHITCRFLPNHGIEYLRSLLERTRRRDVRDRGGAAYSRTSGSDEPGNGTSKPFYFKKVPVQQTVREYCMQIKKGSRKEMNDIDNLVSLCTKCHEKVHRDEINLRLIDTPPPTGKSVYVSVNNK
jgi:hypothetical protein